jgi:Pentapeptide repeats (8 copies)
MRWRDWLGVGERRWPKDADEEVLRPAKTLWDWLQLLIVPVILVGVSLWWSSSQNSRDKSRAEQVRQDTALSDYIQRMSGLMLHEKLLTAKPPNPLSGQPALAVIARTVTLTTLRLLDGERRGKVVLFLREASLIINQDSGPRVWLKDADLSGADLTFADLRGADLSGAALRGADLTDADLRGADLPRANLFQAALRGAFLRDADLTGATLTGAYLTFADLRGADLPDATLSGAFVTGADLEDADLRGADLTGATLTGADLTDAKLRGAKGLPKTTP